MEGKIGTGEFSSNYPNFKLPVFKLNVVHCFLNTERLNAEP